MSYAEATDLLESLDIRNKDANFEIALEVINKYGSYKKAMQATIGIEFKKKTELLIALLGSEDIENANKYTSEAQRLIDLVKEIKDKVFVDSQNLSIQFNNLIKAIRLDAMIDSKDLAVLNAVKPYRNAKLLITNINAYQDGNIQLQAFIDVLKYSENNETLAIDNRVSKMIGR